MNIIKLDAINSTNDYLKELSKKKWVDDFTIVIAKNQLNGKGQMGSKWQVESSKNLTISLLKHNSGSCFENIFNLNILVSVAVFKVLNSYNLPKLAIKWPNDIMADNKKIGGILIENLVKSKTEINSVIGIGINVNQENFEHINKASSIYNLTNKENDIEELTIKIAVEIEKSFKLDFKILKEKYLDILYKKNVPVTFKDRFEALFMGIITGITDDGKLLIKKEDEKLYSFSLKEITMLY